MASQPKNEAKAGPAAAGQQHGGNPTDAGHKNTAHVATVGVDDHGHGGGGAFPPFDQKTFAPQLVWLVLAFGFLYYMLSRKLLPRVSAAIETRADSIRADLAEAEHLKTETETSLKAYDEALAAAKSNAAGIAKTQRETLAAETERERLAVDTEMAAKVNQAEKQIAASKSAALAAVSGVASETVAAIVAKLTGHAVSDDEIARAIALAKGSENKQ